MLRTSLAVNLPLALYVHFPWCVRKCPYCDFNSHVAAGGIPEDAYVEALLRDLDFELREAPETRPLVSIFLGGGTPSLFSDRAVGTLLEAVAKRLAFAPGIEITLEANPGTVDAGHFRGYRAAGVNRLSVGVQSFDDAQLKRLGRIHDRRAAQVAVDVARAAGFDNLNLDLMFALPQQTLGAACDDLRAAIACAPEHLSWYQLTIEPGTIFGARPPKLPDNEAAWAIQQAGQAVLAEAGFAQYEVSAYARAGQRCQHNLNYWTFGDYLAIGAGAHAKRSQPGEHALQVTRRARRRSPQAYLDLAGSKAALDSVRRVGADELPFEYTMNALRLNDGFQLVDFERGTGLAAAALDAPLAQARRLGLIIEAADNVRPSAFGLAHLNDLLELFLP
ncbi:MAG: radical SAM family heme chaperone HemW [Nevskiaceae bacterium]|nr:MAG: radical SAM family heme chaperone HemW [Nevskiaceae bacterium]TBR72739.1 MAG: radical SAM family heme chaperone HemW [Nevskiaceae bacterium]